MNSYKLIKKSKYVKKKIKIQTNTLLASDLYISKPSPMLQSSRKKMELNSKLLNGFKDFHQFKKPASISFLRRRKKKSGERERECV